MLKASRPSRENMHGTEVAVDDDGILIDDSFEIGVRSLTKELGMKVGHAYADFINAKFPFNETSTFPL